MKPVILQSVILSEGERRACLSFEVRRAGVEGPTYFYARMTEADSSCARQSRPAGLSRQQGAAHDASTFNPPRSFGYGSRPSFGKTASPARLAQDDGAFFARRLPEQLP